MIDNNENTPRPKAGLQPVPITDSEMYQIEVEVIKASPNVLDTGTQEEFVEFLEKGGQALTYLQYDEHGSAIGYLALSLLNDSDAVETRSIAVRPNDQSGGHGASMMTEAEEIARSHGRNKMVLVTSPDNNGAVKFYERLGYKVTKTVDNYYGDGTSRLVLEKAI